MKAIAVIGLKGVAKVFRHRVVQAILIAFLGGVAGVLGKETGRSIVEKLRKRKGEAVSGDGTAGNFLSKIGNEIVDSLRGRTKLKLSYDEEKHPGIVYVANLDTSDFGFDQGVLSLPFKIEDPDTPNILTYAGKLGRTGSKWRLEEKRLTCVDATPGNAAPVREGIVLTEEQIDNIARKAGEATIAALDD